MDHDFGPGHEEGVFLLYAIDGYGCRIRYPHVRLMEHKPRQEIQPYEVFVRIVQLTDPIAELTNACC